MKSNAFARHQLHFRIVALACLVFGGWLLIQDVNLSKVGLVDGDGWSLANANPVVWAMAAFMAGMAILATQPQYWDDLFLALMDFGDNGYQVPKPVRFALAALMVCVFGAIAYFVYRFNFTSTHAALYPGQAVTQESAIRTLFFNFGPECLAFLAGQVSRLGAISQQSTLNEKIQVQPDVVYKQAMLKELNKAAGAQAKAQARKGWDAFYKENPDMRPAG